MISHEELKDLLPLAAADVLRPEEAVALQRHTEACAECRKELESLSALVRDCASAPVTAAPPWLMQRTLARARQNQNAGRELQWDAFRSLFLAFLSWATSVAGCWGIHRLTGLGWVSSSIAFALFSGVSALCAAWILRSDLNPFRRENESAY